MYKSESYTKDVYKIIENFNEFLLQFENLNHLNIGVGIKQVKNVVIEYFLLHSDKDEIAESPNGLKNKKIRVFYKADALDEFEYVKQKQILVAYDYDLDEISAFQIDRLHIITKAQNLVKYQNGIFEVKDEILDIELEGIHNIQFDISEKCFLQISEVIEESRSSNLITLQYSLSLEKQRLFLISDFKVISVESNNYFINSKWISLNFHQDRSVFGIRNDFTKLKPMYTIEFRSVMGDGTTEEQLIKVCDEIGKTERVGLYSLNESMINIMHTLLIYPILHLNLIEIRLKERISKPELIEKLGEHLKKNSKLRDLELYVDKKEHVFCLLQSLDQNFMIKTVRINSKEIVDEEIEVYAENFRSQRIAVEIALNSDHPMFKSTGKKQAETYYQD